MDYFFNSVKSKNGLNPKLVIEYPKPSILASFYFLARCIKIANIKPAIKKPNKTNMPLLMAKFILLIISFSMGCG